MVNQNLLNEADSKVLKIIQKYHDNQVLATSLMSMSLNKCDAKAMGLNVVDNIIYEDEDITETEDNGYDEDDIDLADENSEITYEDVCAMSDEKPANDYEAEEDKNSNGKIVSFAELKFKKKLQTEKFNNDEVVEYIKLAYYENNHTAVLRLANLFGPTFFKYWKSHRQLPERPTKQDINDSYQETFAECFFVLQETIDYYWSLKEQGKLEAREGYEKGVDFAYFLNMKLRDVGQTFEKEGQQLSYTESNAKQVKKVKKIIAEYEASHNGERPSDEYIRDALGVKNMSTARYYIGLAGLKVVSGNDEWKSYNSNPSRDNEDYGTLYDFIEDKRVQAPTKNLEVEEIREAVKRLGTVKMTIIAYKYGLTGQEPMTDAEIRQRLHLSKKRYDDLHAKALKALGKSLKGYEGGFSES